MTKGRLLLLAGVVALLSASSVRAEDTAAAEPGEDHLATAKRELLEETGYVAADWRRLGLIHNAIGYSDEGIELWLARGLERREQKLEPGEFLEVFTLPLAEARAMIRDGRITDVKTVAGLLWL